MPPGKKQQRSKSAGPVRSIKGRGDYATVAAISGLAKKLDSTLKKIPKGTLASRGSNIGAAVGRAFGSGLSAITGYGDYTVRGNSLGTVSTSSDMVPQFCARKTGDHATRITHREFIGDLKVPSNPTEFSNAFAHNINPSNGTLFPWLSKMAPLYSQYKIHGMVFVYKTMSSNFSASGGPLGTVIMATNYNVNDLKFGDKIQMENAEFSVSTDPSRNIVHAIECDPKSSGPQTLFVRDPTSNDPTTVGDARFFDYGKIQIATTGLPGSSGTVLGELWVSYDIELLKPVIGNQATQATVALPATVSAIALDSQSDGTESLSAASGLQLAVVSDTYEKAAISTIGFSLTPKWAGTYTGAAILNGNPNTVTTVCRILDGESEAFPKTLRFYRDGTYIIQNVCQFLATSGFGGDRAIRGSSASPNDDYIPTLSISGAGVAGTILVQPGVDMVPHYVLSNGAASGTLADGTTTYDCGLHQTTLVISVSGLPSYDVSKYVILNMPLVASLLSTNTIRKAVRKLTIGWISTRPVQALV